MSDNEFHAREKENMDQPQEEFITDSPREVPPAAKSREQPRPKQLSEDEPAEDRPES